MLIDEIKKANFEAMKNKDATARAILSVVYSDYSNKQIEAKFNNVVLTDADTVAILQKTIKELEDAKVNYGKMNNINKINEMSTQIAVLEKFLPKLLSKQEIVDEISNLADKSIGSVMKHFKSNFAGKCDMQLVNQILKEMPK